MTIQHNLITGSDLHEPKGVAAAGANQVYVANGSGSGAWSTVASGSLNTPRGKFYFYNLGSPYTLSYGGATQKVAPTTVASGLNNLVTEATSARLTYTGTPTVVLKVDFDVAVSQASGSDKKLTIAVHKNGSVLSGSEIYLTSVTSDIHTGSGSCLVSAATNDYFEVFAFNTDGSGDMVFNKVGLTLTQA
jgi:hypothetical protein